MTPKHDAVPVVLPRLPQPTSPQTLRSKEPRTTVYTVAWLNVIEKDSI